MLPQSWPVVREIYRQGIATGNATFEAELPDWEDWDSKHRKDCRLVAMEPVEEEALLSLGTFASWVGPLSAPSLLAAFIPELLKSPCMWTKMRAAKASASRFCKR